MKMKRRIITIFLSILIGGFFAPQFLHADMEWRVIKEIDLKNQPLDMVTALDGKTIFILVPGEVIVQDILNDDNIEK